jgi:hypothetical protein
METLRIRARIDDDRQIVIHLPDDAPTGEVELVIQVQIPDEARNSPRERLRAQLRAADLLATDFPAPEVAHMLTQDEIFALSGPLPDGRTTLDYINEDRGEF